MRLLFIIFVAFCTVSCMDFAKVAPPIHDLGVVQNVEMLELGRDLYVHGCSKCHNALRITRYSKKKWARILPSMVKESAFNAVESEAVAAYINAVLHFEESEITSAVVTESP